MAATMTDTVLAFPGKKSRKIGLTMLDERLYDLIDRIQQLDETVPREIIENEALKAKIILEASKTLIASGHLKVEANRLVDSAVTDIKMPMLTD
jgi:hypothetical protein